MESGIDSIKAVELAVKALGSSGDIVHCFTRVRGGVVITFVDPDIGRPDIMVADPVHTLIVTDSGSVSTAQ